MPALSQKEATERLALVVEKATPSALAEIYDELFPQQPKAADLSAGELASHIRGGLAGEEIADLWNVVFPKDRNVWYDDESSAIHYNEEMLDYADTE